MFSVPGLLYDRFPDEFRLQPLREDAVIGR